MIRSGTSPWTGLGTAPSMTGGTHRWRPVAADAVPVVLGIGALALLFLVPLGGAILLSIAVAVTFVTMMAPPVGIASLATAVAFNTIGEQTIGGVDVIPAQAIVWAVLVGWGIRTLALRQPMRLSPIVVPQVAYLLVVLLSVIVAENRGAWGRELYEWEVAPLIFVIATQSLQRLRDAWLAISVFSVAAIAMGIAALNQVINHLGPASYEVGGLQRAYASWVGPNPFAMYIDMTFPILTAVSAAWLVAVAPWVRDRVPPLARTIPWRVGLLATGGAGFSALSLFLTQSRGGWIGCAVGLAVVALLLGGVYRAAFLVGTFVLLLVILLTPFGDPVLNRFSPEAIGISFGSEPVEVTSANWAVQERLAMYRAGIHMAEDNPWLGVGAGNFNQRYREYTEVWRFRIPRGHAHNAYIQAAAQTGFIGLTVYLALIGTVAWRLRYLWRISRGSARIVVVGVIGVSAAVATHNLFDYLHAGLLPIQLSIVWALAEVARAPRAASTAIRQERSPRD